MKQLFRLAALTLVCALSLHLIGCAQMTMAPPKPSVENTAKLRNGTLAPANVGSFALDANRTPGMDRGIDIRTNNLSSPIETSFAQYLRETLRVELQSAGLFDPNGSSVISGFLTDSSLDTKVDVGKAALAARFVVTRAGEVRYNRELRVSATWESSFLGPVAIPPAAGQYEALYRKLVGVLLDDASFRQAMESNSRFPVLPHDERLAYTRELGGQQNGVGSCNPT